MTSINKKKIALKEKYNQEKLRNLSMKKVVTLKSPETVFLSNVFQKHHLTSLTVPCIPIVKNIIKKYLK